MSTPALIGRGALAGVAGTAVMTGFQLLVEMPLTRRGESFAPAMLAGKLLPVRPKSRAGRRRLNYAAHFALGMGWGAAFGVAARAGLRGQPAVGAVFGALFPADVLLATALRIYEPTTWSAQDWAIDVVDKLVQAEATGLTFDRIATARD